MMTRIRTYLTLAVLPWLFASCGVNSPPKQPGELGREFTSTIPGVWAGELSNGGRQIRMVKQFLPDGRAMGVLMMKQTGGGVSLVMPEIPFTSRWRVKGDVVETYDAKSGIPGLFKPGQVIRDHLLSVSPDRIVTRAENGGGLEVIQRVKSSR